jgi:SAM-dependent methyltransferase
VRRFVLLTLDRVGQVFERLSRACLYFSAALSTLSDLRDGTEAAWNDFLIDDDQIASGWMRWEQLAADAIGLREGMRVLVVGCGSGRDIIPFLHKGCAVTGVDPAPVAIAAARRALASRGLEATLINGFFEDCQLDGRYDVVWFSWFAYSYIPGEVRRIDALLKARRLLQPTGHIVVSLTRYPPRSRLTAVAVRLSRLRRADWAMSEGDVFTRIPGSRHLRYEHFFQPDEADREVHAAGLHTTASFEAHTVLVLEPIDRATQCKYDT